MATSGTPKARRTVSVSEEVYACIAGNGRFGESIDDVLRRLLQIGEEAVGPSSATAHPTSTNAVRRHTTRRLTAKRLDGALSLTFAAGPTRIWPLPPREDHRAIAALSIEAKAWAESQGASFGQLKAIHKTLTEGGYYNTGPRQ